VGALKSPKREKFCQNIAKGMSDTDAYKKSGYSTKNMKPATINREAHELRKNPNISARIKELQEKAETDVVMSVRERMVWLTNLINGTYKEKVLVEGVEAEREAYTPDKLKALDILNKMCGTYIEKVEQINPPSIVIERPKKKDEN